MPRPLTANLELLHRRVPGRAVAAVTAITVGLVGAVRAAAFQLTSEGAKNAHEIGHNRPSTARDSPSTPTNRTPGMPTH